LQAGSIRAHFHDTSASVVSTTAIQIKSFVVQNLFEGSRARLVPEVRLHQRRSRSCRRQQASSTNNSDSSANSRQHTVLNNRLSTELLRLPRDGGQT
jgi:hypothetical protein